MAGTNDAANEQARQDVQNIFDRLVHPFVGVNAKLISLGPILNRAMPAYGTHGDQSAGRDVEHAGKYLEANQSPKDPNNQPLG